MGVFHNICQRLFGYDKNIVYKVILDQIFEEDPLTPMVDTINIFLNTFF